MPNFSEKVVSPGYDLNVKGVAMTELPGFKAFKDLVFYDSNGYSRPLTSMGPLGPFSFMKDGSLLLSVVASVASANYYFVGVFPGSNSIYTIDGTQGADSVYYTQTPFEVSSSGSCNWASPMLCVNDGLASNSGGRIIQGSATIDNQSYKGCLTIRTNSQGPGHSFFPQISVLPISEPGITVSSPVLFGTNGCFILNNSIVYVYVPESSGSNSLVKVGNIPPAITQELNNRPQGRVPSTNTFLHRYTHWDAIGSVGGTSVNGTIINTMRNLFFGSSSHTLELVFTPPSTSDIICSVCYNHYDSRWYAVTTVNHTNFRIYRSSVGEALGWSHYKDFGFRNPQNNSPVPCIDPISIFPFRGRLFLSAGNGLYKTFIDTIEGNTYLSDRGAAVNLQSYHYSQPHVSIHNDSKIALLMDHSVLGPVIAGHNSIVI